MDAEIDTGSEDGATVGPAGAVRLGRPFDRSRDREILSTVLDLLAESGYEQLTIDEVARRSGRAKTTLYRRWPTKVDLVVAAVRAAGRPPESTRLPNRGSLRDDLLAVIDSPWLGGCERRLAVFAGLTTAARLSPPLADVIRTEITEPYVAVYQALLERTGAAGASPDRVSLLAEVIPAMTSHRLALSDGPVDRAYFVAVVDDVLLPAVAGAT